MSTDPNVAGGKAAGLARLVEAGANVPPFFALPGDAFVDHLAACGLRGSFADALRDCGEAEVKVVSERLTSRLLETSLDDALRARIAAGIDGWDEIAVRSSMVGEDSAAASFAGQLESFLYRRGADAVADAVLHCWASALGERVLVYRLRHEGRLSLPRVGVVVQRMVTGEVSGVVFTAHPVTGRRDHTLVTAAWGLGEGVVSGVCNADDYVVAHDGGEVEHAVADKDVRLVRPPDGAPGTVEEEVPTADRERRCLSEADAVRVAAESLRVARAFGAAQDLEFTFADGELFLLQARPITKLPEPEHEDGPVVVFDNSNIQESYCGVTTPLTFSFAQKAYASVYEQTMRAVGIPQDVITAHADMLRNMLGLVRGRVYYNINNWYRGLLLLPSFGRNKEDMEAMMGLTDPVDFVVDVELSLGQKLARLPRMLLTLWRLASQFRRLPVSVGGFLKDFELAYAALDRPSFADASFSVLMEKLELLDALMLGRWHVPIVNDFYVMMTTGKLRRLLGDDLASLYPGLMSGEEGIESTEPTKALLRMAAHCRTSEALAAAVRADDRDALLADVDFRDAFEHYVERYGDRVMGELKLETVTARTDPTFVFDCVRGFLDRDDLDPDSLARREQELRAEAEAAAGSRLAKLRGPLRKAREAVKNRENMRLARTRMFGLYRDVYAALGERLHEVGRLDEARDVFYLTVDEIRALHEGTSTGADVAGLARVRKAEFAEYAATPEPPHHFSTRGPVHVGNRYRGPDRPPPDGDAKLLSGIGCYPGVVEADLRVILSPDDDLGVQGRILTTVRTDPGWAPLFPAAAGILVERGSTLSHSAVVARELGIPAVVGVPGLLQIVEDGEPVRLDGGAGTVERLS